LFPLYHKGVRQSRKLLISDMCLSPALWRIQHLLDTA
jgi:hypothetical protein